jgi:hypothetical protein
MKILLAFLLLVLASALLPQTPITPTQVRQDQTRIPAYQFSDGLTTITANGIKSVSTTHHSGPYLAMTAPSGSCDALETGAMRHHGTHLYICLITDGNPQATKQHWFRTQLEIAP